MQQNFGVRQIEAWKNTPQAFANLSPGVGAQRQPWESKQQKDGTLKGLALRETLSGFVANCR